MKLGFVVTRPTQFEAPFYRFAAGDPESTLRVLFTEQAAGAAALDPELGRKVDWGFDLLEGYPHDEMPATGLEPWLARHFREHLYDLLIVNGYTLREYRAVATAARKGGIPVGLRIDSVAFADRPATRLVKRLLFPLLALRYDLFFAVGTLTRRYLEACGIPAGRVALFPYAVDAEGFAARARVGRPQRDALRRRWQVPEDAFVILAVSKLGERETPWDLFEASAHMGAGQPWIVVAGDGPGRADAEAFARERGLDRVRFLGYVPYGELPSVYAAADLFVHAPREERWGVSVAEAMACGLPVVVSDRVGAGEDLIVPGANGFIYPAGHPRALAGHLETVARGLDSDRLGTTHERLLERWGYAATWRSLQEAARASSAISDEGALASRRV